MALIPRQLKHERGLPPPYTPPSVESGIGVSRLLELGPTDDGTHDVYSDPNVSGRSGSRSTHTQSDMSTDVEMREVQLEERWSPVTLARAMSAPRWGVTIDFKFDHEFNSKFVVCQWRRELYLLDSSYFNENFSDTLAQLYNCHTNRKNYRDCILDFVLVVKFEF